MEFPNTVQELFMLLVTNVVFLGAVSALLTGFLWRTGWNPSENVKRGISLAIPFVVAFGAFFGQLLFGYVTAWDENTIYGIVLVGIAAGYGKQAIYAAYKGTKNVLAGPKPDIENQI